MRTLFYLPLLLLSFGVCGQGFMKSFYQKINHKHKTKRDNKWANETMAKSTLLGAGVQVHQNQNFSQSQFSGPMATIQSVKYHTYGNIENLTQTVLGVGAINVPKGEDPTFSFSAQTELGKLWKIKEGVYVGPNVGQTSNVRFNNAFENNALGAEFAFDLGPKIHLRNSFKFLDEKFNVNFIFATPIIGFIKSMPTRTISFDLDLPGGLKTINHYQRVNSGLWFDWQNSKRFVNRSWSLGYQWTALHLQLNESNNLTTAQHSINLIGSLKRIK